jgi:hypothetical protein
MDATKISDGGTTKFWIYKDIELPNEQGKKEKLPVFVALVDDAGIRNFVRGKKFLCSGTCHLDGGKVAFEPIKGIVPYRLLKTSSPILLGKQLHVPANANDDDGGEGVEDESDEHSAPGPSGTPSGVNLAAAWGVLMKECQAAIAANPSRKEALMQAIGPIPDLIKANNVEEANAKMEMVRSLLQSPAPAPSNAVSTANLAATWTALFKECQAAVAANPARKEALQHAAAGIPDLIKANNIKDATAKMDALRQLLDSAPPPQPGGGNLATTWAGLLKECQAAVAANPARKEALQHAAAGIPDLIKANNVKEATAKMEALRHLLDAPPSAPPSGSVPPANLAATWNGLVKEYQAAVAANPARREALAHAAAGIPDLIKSNPAEAKKKMDALAALLAAPTPTQDESTEETDPRADEFKKRYAVLQKQLLEALKNPASDASNLRAVSGFASEKAAARDYDAALKALDRLEKDLSEESEVRESEGEESSTGTPYKGLVAYRKSLLAFDAAKKTVDAQVQALAKALASREDHEDLADAVEEQLSGLNEEIGDAIDDAMSAAENDAAPVTDAVKASIQKYLDEVVASPLVKRADSNPFGVNVSIEKTLVAALQHVRQSLPVQA